MFDISVIVPTHNRANYLAPLLASLARQQYPAERWELVIVDDGSTDGTREYLEAYPGPRPLNTRVVSQPQNGVATTRNNGATLALGRALLFIDDDMIPTSSLVAAHASVHLQDDRAVMIGHISLPTEGREPWVAWEDAQLVRHYDALKSGRRVPGPRDVYTGNCSVSAHLFKSVGGFDTSLLRTEDVELGYRLRDAGAKFYYRAEADSLHLGRHGFDGWLRNARLYGQMDVLLARDKGHVELQQEIVRWFQKRSRLNKSLVRICSAWPALEAPAISVLRLVGGSAYRAGAARASSLCYSAINNLAYWLSLINAVGRKHFWSSMQAGQSLSGGALSERALAYARANPNNYPVVPER